MTTPAQQSGVDLARQALVAAREAAKKNRSGPAQKPRRRTVTVRRDGREPYGLGEAIMAMMTERAWSAPAAGGDVLAQWSGILTAVAPELAGHAQAVRFDAETGQLDVVPDAPAYGTKLRWTAPKLIDRANQQVKGANVRTIHVLAPAARTIADPATAVVRVGPEPVAAPPAPGPVRTRESASAGYHRTLEAHRAVRAEPLVAPAVAAAIERQDRALRQQREAAVSDVGADLEELRERARQKASSVDASHARALKRLADERAGRV